MNGSAVIHAGRLGIDARITVTGGTFAQEEATLQATLANEAEEALRCGMSV